jgi:DNA repair protein RAD5
MWRLFDAMVMRHTKDQGFGERQALLTLPKRHVHIEKLEFDAEERKAYDQLEDLTFAKFSRLLEAGLVTHRMLFVMAMVTPLRQACSGGALNIAEHVEAKRVFDEEMDNRHNQ